MKVLFDLDEYLNAHFSQHTIDLAEDLCSENNINIIVDKEDEILAKVSVPNKQTVETHLTDGKITSQLCTCNSEYCVHKAIVLLYYFEYRLDLLPHEDEIQKEELLKMIENAKKDQLSTLVSELAGLNDGNEAYIFDFFKGQDKSNLRAYYTQQVNRFFDQHIDEFLGLDIDGLPAIEHHFTEKIDQLYSKEKYKELFYLLTALIKRLHKENMEAYDILEELEELEEYVFEKLGDIHDKNLYSEKDYREIFDHVLSLLDIDGIDAFDYSYNILETIAPNVFDNISYHKLEAKLHDLINAKKEDFGKYHLAEFSMEILLIAKENYASKEEILDYMYEHIDFPAICTKLIGLKIQDRSFTEAKSLAQNGLNLAETCEFEDEILTFKELLLEVAVKEENENDIYEWAYHLLMQYDFNKKHYNLLKIYAPADEWPEIRSRVIERSIHRSIDLPDPFLVDILIKEELYDELLNYLKQLGYDFGFLDQYEAIFPEKYTGQLIQAYMDRIRFYIDHHTSRNNYKLAVQYIEKIKSMGAAEESKHLVMELRSKYPNRKALQKELKDLGEDPAPDLFSST